MRTQECNEPCPTCGTCTDEYIVIIGQMSLVNTLTDEVLLLSGQAEFEKSGGCSYPYIPDSEAFVATLDGESVPVAVTSMRFDCSGHLPNDGCHGETTSDYWRLELNLAVGGIQVDPRYTGGLIGPGQECMPERYTYCTDSIFPAWSVTFINDVQLF